MKNLIERKELPKNIILTLIYISKEIEEKAIDSYKIIVDNKFTDTFLFKIDIDENNKDEIMNNLINLTIEYGYFDFGSSILTYQKDILIFKNKKTT